MGRCKYRHDPPDFDAPVAGSADDNRDDSASSGIAKPAAEGTGCNRNGLGSQRNGSDGTSDGSPSRVGNAGTESSSRAIIAGRSMAAVEPAMTQGGWRQQLWRRYY